MTNIIGPDVSFYQDENDTSRMIDFNKMRTNGASFVIIRAGQNSWPDPDFAPNWIASKNAGLPRGSYWYYDSREDPIVQAETWAVMLRDDHGELPIFPDFEEHYGGTYKGWFHWKTFLERMKQLLPGKEIVIYTGPSYWKENVPVEAREYFKQYPLWIANYGVSKPAIPEPWQDWLFWQYTESGPGLAFGAESKSIDLNYFNGDIEVFNKRFGIDPGTPSTPPVVNKDESFNTHVGVTMHKMRRFGTDCIVHVFDLSKVKMKLTRPFSEVPAAVHKAGATHGFNNGGWGLQKTSKGAPNEYLIIEGQVIQNKAIDGRPCMDISKDGKISFLERPNFKTAYNVIGFDRLISVKGQYNTRIKDHSRAPRTIYGKDAMGRLVILTCEGRALAQAGLTFEECWQVMKEFGVTDCGNADGGYSTCAVNTAVSQDTLIKSYLVERRLVVCQTLFFAEPIPGNPVPDADPIPTVSIGTLLTRDAERLADLQLLGHVAELAKQFPAAFKEQG